jgi:hypothetical protein
MTDRPPTRKRLYGVQPLASFVAFGAVVLVLGALGRSIEPLECHLAGNCGVQGDLMRRFHLPGPGPEVFLFAGCVIALIAVIAVVNTAVWVDRRSVNA